MSNFCAALINHQRFVRPFVHHELMRSRNQSECCPPPHVFPGKRLNPESQLVELAVATTNAMSHTLNHIQTSSLTLSRMFVESKSTWTLIVSQARLWQCPHQGMTRRGCAAKCLWLVHVVVCGWRNLFLCWDSVNVVLLTGNYCPVLLQAPLFSQLPLDYILVSS